MALLSGGVTALLDLLKPTCCLRSAICSIGLPPIRGRLPIISKLLRNAMDSIGSIVPPFWGRMPSWIFVCGRNRSDDAWRVVVALSLLLLISRLSSDALYFIVRVMPPFRGRLPWVKIASFKKRENTNKEKQQRTFSGGLYLQFKYKRRTNKGPWGWARLGSLPKY